MAAPMQVTTTTPLIEPRPLILSHPPVNGPIRVLALDGAPGGALRGYAQIKIVRSLMEMVWQNNHPGRPIIEGEVDAMRPCDHFNMIFGSGTGGAIAVYLGRLNLTIKECEDHYKQLGDRVYAHPCSMWNPFHRFNYDFELLEGVLQEQTKPFLPANANVVLEFGHQGRHTRECKAAVLTKMVHNTQAVHLIKSYEVGSGQVWEAIRATTAAYYDFPNVTVGRLKLISPDAGFSNPSGKAWIEATTLYPQNHGINRGIWFISIGSGVEPENPLHEPTPNELEARIHVWLTNLRSSIEGLLSGRAKGAVTAVGYGTTMIQTCAGYGWEFGRGSLPGRSEMLRVLAQEIHSRDAEMQQRIRRPFVQRDLGKLHYYRLDLKLERSEFEYDAWNHHEGLLKPVFSTKNPALLPDGTLMRSINTACGFLVHRPNNDAVPPNVPPTVPPARILTLDGSPGALGALVQLKIIREVMSSIWRQEMRQAGRPGHPLKGSIDNMRPAKYFDLIVGSGTGGAIAIYLGWFKFTIKECEDHFRSVGNRVYSTPFSRLSVWQRYNYDQKSLEEILKDQSRSCDLGTPLPESAPDVERKSQDRKLQHKFCYQQYGDRRCKVAVLASKFPDRSPDILRSYGDGGIDGAHNADVWQAMQVTMASHGDFSPVQIGEFSLRGPEAGWSNPAIAALNEAQKERLFGPGRDICLISIGSGLHPSKPAPNSVLIETRIQQAMVKLRTLAPNVWAAVRGKMPHKLHALRDLAIGCENENRKMLAQMRPQDLRHYFDPETSKYFRFNIDDFALLDATAWNQTNKDIVEEWASTLAADTDQNRLSKLLNATEQL